MTSKEGVILDVQRFQRWLADLGHVIGYSQCEPSAMWRRAAVTFHPEMCCFVTSCCLKDDGEKSVCVSEGRESESRRRDMWSPETFPEAWPEHRSLTGRQSDTISYVTGTIDKTKSGDNGPVQVHVAAEAIFCLWWVICTVADRCKRAAEC